MKVNSSAPRPLAHAEHDDDSVLNALFTSNQAAEGPGVPSGPSGSRVTGSYPELPGPRSIGRLALYSSVNVQATRSLCIDPCRWTVACYRPRTDKRPIADAVRSCRPQNGIDGTKASSKCLIQPLFRHPCLCRKLRAVLPARPTAADSRHTVARPAGSLDLARSDPLGRPPGLGYPWLHRRPALLTDSEEHSAANRIWRLRCPGCVAVCQCRP